MNFPLVVFLVCVLLLSLATWFGTRVRRKRGLTDDVRGDLELVVAATLTLLGLIIGFSFSMATNRYDQRKNYEEAEANAIGTEYVRADLLPAESAAKVKSLLRTYTDERILFYTTRDPGDLQKVNERTAQTQSDLWSAILPAAAAQPTPVTALVVAGMNDVLNSQGYTQAAWWNRIPIAAWALMVTIAFCSNALIGYSSRREKASRPLFFILPVVLSIAFLLIDDIDSPRGGFVRVRPMNLHSLAASLNSSK